MKTLDLTYKRSKVSTAANVTASLMTKRRTKSITSATSLFHTEGILYSTPRDTTIYVMVAQIASQVNI